jgi:hypothetical protein
MEDKMDKKMALIDSLGREVRKENGMMLYVEMVKDTDCEGAPTSVTVVMSHPESEMPDMAPVLNDQVLSLPKAAISYIASAFGVSYKDILLALVNEEMSSKSPFDFQTMLPFPGTK